MKHTWKRWITAALALVLVAALFGCTGEESDKMTWTPGAFEKKDGNGDPSYSIRLPLSSLLCSGSWPGLLVRLSIHATYPLLILGAARLFFKVQ